MVTLSASRRNSAIPQVGNSSKYIEVPQINLHSITALAFKEKPNNCERSDSGFSEADTIVIHSPHESPIASRKISLISPQTSPIFSRKFTCSVKEEELEDDTVDASPERVVNITDEKVLNTLPAPKKSITFEPKVSSPPIRKYAPPKKIINSGKTALLRQKFENPGTDSNDVKKSPRKLW